MKKITTLVLSLVLVLAMSITAFAATPKDSILSALKSAGVEGEYYTQAEKFLADNEVTAEQASAVVAQIEAAQKTANGVTDISKLSAAQKSSILNNINAAAKAVGAEATIDAAKGTLSVTKNGKTYSVSAKPVKATGASTTATVAGIAVLAMGLVACGVAVSKKRFA